MRKKFLKTLSCILSLIMLLTSLPCVAVFAEDERPENTYRYYFYRPVSWAETSDKVGVYWWEGTDACGSWPGYEMNKTDVDGIYYYDVPEDVSSVVFSNCYDTNNYEYQTGAYVTNNVMCEYYDMGETPIYPNGTSNFDNMIFVLDGDSIQQNEFTGIVSGSGMWFYYYGNGEYGTAEVKTEDIAVFTSETYDIAKLAPNGEKVPEDGMPWGLKYTIENGEVTIDYYEGLVSEVVIPAEIEGYPVTSIAENAFSNYSTNVTSVTVPETVTDINKNAFSNSNYLEEIIVSENNPNYKSVDGVLFSKDLSTLLRYPCDKSGEEYAVPDEVKVIAEEAFSGCEIIKVILPEGLEEIGELAFYYCTDLIEMNISDSVEVIVANAFNSCYELTQINVSENNPNYASYNGALYTKDFSELLKYPCGSLETAYEIHKDTIKIKEYAFLASDYLEKVICPDGLKKIEDGAFESCENLTEINLPESLNYIGAYAFIECYDLKHITIPAEVVVIRDYTFGECTSLESVTFSGVVKSIADTAFWYVEDIQDVYFAGNAEQWDELDLSNYYHPLTSANVHLETTSPHYELASVVTEATCSEGGEYKYACPCGFEKTVYLDKLGHDFEDGTCKRCNAPDFPESEHDYENNCDKTWVIYRENAKRIKVTFSEDFRLENNYDILEIFNSDDEIINYYSGTSLAGKTIVVYGDTVKIRLTSDGSVSYYGFKVTDVEAIYEDDVDYGIESAHPYDNNWNETWEVYRENAKKVSVTFSEDTYVEEEFDYITIYNAYGDMVGEYTGSQLAGQTVTADGDTMLINLVTDSSATYFGFKVIDVVAEYEEESSVVTEPTESTVATETTEATTESSVVTEPTEATTESSVVTEPTESTTESSVVTEPTESTTESSVVTEPTESTTESSVVTEPTETTKATEVSTIVTEPTEAITATETEAIKTEEVTTETTESSSTSDVNTTTSTDAESETTLATEPSEPAVDKGILGDVNGDGKVNIKDATLIQKAAAKISQLTDDENIRADVTADSKINIKDATAIQKYAAKIEVAFPIGKPITK